MPLQSIESEFKISKSVYDAGICIPEPVELFSHDGRSGIVYERLVGSTMLKAIVSKPWSIKKVAAKMATIHANIHQKSISDLPKQKEVMAQRIKEAPMLSDEEKGKILEHLMGLREGIKLCHGDFHPDNIILGEKVWTIDWMTGMAGNPAGDVARTILLIKLGTMPEGTPKILEYLVSRIRKLLVTGYISEYINSSEIEMEEVNQWMVPVAAARLIPCSNKSL